MKKVFMNRFLLALFLLTAPCFAATEPSGEPIRVKLQGMVCPYCARGLKEILHKQANVDRFDIRVPTGEVLLWPSEKGARPTEEEIKVWVEKSGLEVAPSESAKL